MPIHNWKAAPVGLYHHFHQSWACQLCNELNAGRMPACCYALIETHGNGSTPFPDSANRADADVYAKRANRVAVRNNFGEVVALIELVSPGNKDNKHAIRAFIEKAAEFIENRVNLLVVDLFPPTPRDPQGIHKAIWDQFHEEPFELPPDKPLTLASYAAGDTKTAYVEVTAVGDALPSMPLFLDPATYVPAPLEETYTRTWEKCPAEMRAVVESNVAPP
jgi:hypothetical protein